jgi:hypothetical protein
LILSHLLPPAPPLPHPYLSRTFIERLTFLPPADDDLDAHLTPFAAPMAKNALNPNVLHVALEQLAGSMKINDTEYAHDGEMTVARTRLQPEYGFGGDEVEAYFEHEDAGRGWVYRGASLASQGAGATHGSAWDWKETVADVHPAYPRAYDSATADAPEDYWAGFTPPHDAAQLPNGHDDEDDYWAQYGAGAPEHEPAHDYDHEHETETVDDRASEPANDAEPVTPPSATLPHPDPAATLSLLLSGLGASPAAAPKTPSPSSSILEEKVRAKVRAQLMRAWTAFSADQDAESAAFEWLRAVREIAERPPWAAAPVHDAWGDVRVAVVHARIDAAKDMFDVLSTDGFFRLCEEAIRVHSPLGDGVERDEEAFEYES